MLEKHVTYAIHRRKFTEIRFRNQAKAMLVTYIKFQELPLVEWRTCYDGKNRCFEYCSCTAESVSKHGVVVEQSWFLRRGPKRHENPVSRDKGSNFFENFHQKKEKSVCGWKEEENAHSAPLLVHCVHISTIFCFLFLFFPFAYTYYTSFLSKFTNLKLFRHSKSPFTSAL